MRVVELVHKQKRGLADALDEMRATLSSSSDADRTIDDEKDDVGLLGTCQGLVANGGGEDVIALHRLDAAGVDEGEGPAVPFGIEIAAISGDATALVHDGIGGWARRLTSVDFPTLGRPTTATMGFDMQSSSCRYIYIKDTMREGCPLMPDEPSWCVQTSAGDKEGRPRWPPLESAGRM